MKEQTILSLILATFSHSVFRKFHYVPNSSVLSCISHFNIVFLCMKRMEATERNKARNILTLLRTDGTVVYLLADWWKKQTGFLSLSFGFLPGFLTYKYASMCVRNRLQRWRKWIELIPFTSYCPLIPHFPSLFTQTHTSSIHPHVDTHIHQPICTFVERHIETEINTYIIDTSNNIRNIHFVHGCHL